MNIFPHMKSRRITLQPKSTSPTPEDYNLILKLGLDSTSNFESFSAAMQKKSIDANFSIRLNGDDSAAGFSMLLDLDQDAGHVHTAVYIDPAAARQGIGADATLLTVNYAFAMWNIRKVYFETTDASSGDFGAMLEKPPEATLNDYIFFRGRLWDLKVYALTRDEWEKELYDYVRKLAPQD